MMMMISRQICFADFAYSQHPCLSLCLFVSVCVCVCVRYILRKRMLQISYNSENK